MTNPVIPVTSASDNNRIMLPAPYICPRCKESRREFSKAPSGTDWTGWWVCAGCSNELEWQKQKPEQVGPSEVKA